MSHQNSVVTACADLLVGLFPEVPPDFRHCGQTLHERAEAWVSHAIDELEEETDCGGDDAEEEPACGGDVEEGP